MSNKSEKKLTLKNGLQKFLFHLKVSILDQESQKKSSLSLNESYKKHLQEVQDKYGEPLPKGCHKDLEALVATTLKLEKQYADFQTKYKVNQ